MKVMKKVLTMKQLEARFSGEWVLLVNPVQNKDSEIVRGELVFHSKDRSEVYRDAFKREHDHTAVLYVGKLPEDLAVVL
jgi:hypothetical protein